MLQFQETWITGYVRTTVRKELQGRESRMVEKGSGILPRELRSRHIRYACPNKSCGKNDGGDLTSSDEERHSCLLCQSPQFIPPDEQVHSVSYPGHTPKS